MQIPRIGFRSLVAVSAIVAGLALAGPGFAGGKGGGGGGGGGAAKGGSGANTKTPPAKAKTVLDVLGEDGSLSKFAAALKAADLEGTLKGSGPFTVLAPSDAAIGKLDPAKWADLQKSKDKLKALLQGHILSSKMKAADIAKATKLSGMGGVSHEVKLGDDKQPVIDGVAKITKQDVEGSNGLIQILDTVLMPAEKTPAPAPGGGK